MMALFCYHQNQGNWSLYDDSSLSASVNCNDLQRKKFVGLRTQDSQYLFDVQREF